MAKIKKCPDCNTYTLESICPECGKPTSKISKSRTVKDK